MEQAQQSEPHAVDFAVWRNHLAALVDCSKKLNNTLAEVRGGEIPETVDELVAQRQQVLMRLEGLGENLRKSGGLELPDEIRDLISEARTLSNEGVQLLRVHRARLLEEIKRTDRHQAQRNPYRTL